MLPDLEKLFGVIVMISSKILILLQYRYNVPHPNYVCMFTVITKITVLRLLKAQNIFTCLCSKFVVQ